MNPCSPIYVVSKGRWSKQITSTHLDRMGIPHFVVVERQEAASYEARALGSATYLVLDPAYQRNYDTCDDYGLSKSTGPGPARNFAWDHAVASSALWHWVMDDNIDGWYRFNRNWFVRFGDGTVFRCMEEFAGRYANVAMAGPNYFMFVKRRDRLPPFVANTRIYSCNLIRNEVPFRWRGRYNEDTDLSLRLLKAGWATVQFNAFLQAKVATQSLSGGNTDAFYRHEGTRPKSEMLARLHPDVARVSWKFGRWHHEVDYAPFARTPLLRRADVAVSPGVDEFGLVLEQRDRTNGGWFPAEKAPWLKSE